jgi:polysaccharide export outer membrane protein
MRKLALAAMVSASLAGCGVIPKDGPRAGAVTGGATALVADSSEKIDYVQVDLNAETVKAANKFSYDSVRRFSGLGKVSADRDVSIGYGDVVSVTVFEAESGGPFLPKDSPTRSNNYVQIPNQQVDRDGNINVPYVQGAVRVVGRTPKAVAAEITSKLKQRAIDPQVVVTVVEHRGNAISVLGDVGSATRFSMDPGGIRLSGAIARAGGPKSPAYETVVNLQRNGVAHMADFQAVVRDPGQDVPLAPGDVVYLSHVPKFYMVLGSTSPGVVGGVNNRRFTFELENMSMTEALAKAGWLDTTRANAGEVFLFRFEKPALLSSLGVDVSRFKSDLIPTVYRVDFSSAEGFYLANLYNMRNRDVIFVSESIHSDIQKVLSIVALSSYSVLNASEAANYLR